ncbi:hypothetical protein ABPG72_000716 [Tetrahymena utriculariae]
MNFYQNSFLTTGYAQGYDNASMKGQNIAQIQCSPAFVMQPQTMPCLQFPIAANNLPQQMPYQPYVMYTQVHPYPAYNVFNPMQYQYPNISYNNQPSVQMFPANVNQNIPVNQSQQSLSQGYQNQVKSEYNVQPYDTDTNKQCQNNSCYENQAGQSEKTSQITENNEQKYTQEKEFTTSQTQNKSNLKQKKKEQQDTQSIQESIQKSALQQNSKQTSEIIIKPQNFSAVQNISSVKIDIMSKDQSQNVKNISNQEGKQEENNKKGQFLFKLSSKDVNTLKQLQEVNIQNAFKNILKGFTQHVNNCFDHIYIYDYESEVNKQDEELMNIKRIENPSQQQKKIFIQKFNKFIKNKKYNNTSIRQIIENKLYSSVLNDYIVNYSPSWIKQSSFQSKEDIITVLNFFKMCCDNPNLLLFLSKQNDKLIPSPSIND